MTRLTLFLIVLYAVLFGALSYAHAAGDTESLDQRLDDNDLDVDESDRSAASANAIASANARGRVNSVPVGPSPPLKLTECIVCTDCPKVAANSSSKICPYTSDPSKQGKCVVYAEKYKYLKRPWYIRGCASDRGSCGDIRKAHANHPDIVNLLSCNECEGDRCNTNGVARSLPDLTMAFFVLIVTPVLAKYSLS